MKPCEQNLPFAPCHSERNEESSPCANAQGDEKSAIDMSLICDIDLM